MEHVRLLFQKVTCFSYDVISEMVRHSLTVQECTYVYSTAMYICILTGKDERIHFSNGLCCG